MIRLVMKTYQEFQVIQWLIFTGYLRLWLDGLLWIMSEKDDLARPYML